MQQALCLFCQVIIPYPSSNKAPRDSHLGRSSQASVLLSACLQVKMMHQTMQNWILYTRGPARTCRGAGAIELLAARSLALLRSLTEFEQKPFLDQASESPATKELARHTATRATHFAGQSAPLKGWFYNRRSACKSHYTVGSSGVYLSYSRHMHMLPGP